MKNFYTKVLVVLGFLLIASLVACTATETTNETDPTADTELETGLETDETSDAESDTEPVPETEPETFDYSPYEKTEGSAFLYNTGSTMRSMSVKTQKYATRVEVAENTFLNSLTISFMKVGTESASMEFSIWSWKGNYKSTVAAEPTYTCTLQNDYGTNPMVDYWMTVNFPAMTVGKGEWLIEVSNGTDNVRVNVASSSRKDGAGDEFVSVKSTYVDGLVNYQFTQSYVIYETYDLTKEIQAPDADGYIKPGEGKAHVILLSGQSNASGQSWNEFLQGKVSDEAWERYNQGYQNVQIYYNVDGTNMSNGFVPVKLGQGPTATQFGPEVGLADFLSQAYPNEIFYIIKVSFSGTSLQNQWKDGTLHYATFEENIQTALDKLVDPEIFAMLWMQGESDAMSLADTKLYAEAEAELMERINTRFADYIVEGGFALLDATICEQSNWQYGAIVNMHKRAYAAKSQNRYVLDTNALDIDTRDEYTNDIFESDSLHYDSDDMIELGVLFGQGIQTILTNAGY